ncbi:hypothetical protein BC831DRAFT_493197 [Entophlyctis helioformis]|nr:hypothetical protein BC831DRAFT_493197 [Entophlyctis helioformis]
MQRHHRQSLSASSIATAADPSAPHPLAPPSVLPAAAACHFNTVQGNVIEFQYPPTAPIAGVEYKSIPSGAHAVAKDVVFFSSPAAPGSQTLCYGVACLENVALSADHAAGERGARIKAVGLLATSHVALHNHLAFLRVQTARFVRNLGTTAELRAYFTKHCVPALPVLDLAESMSLAQLQIGHPAAHLSSFVRSFESKIFVLWKHALLQKRILFFGNPPTERTCHNVFCTLLLALHSASPRFQVHSNPLFFTNVADIDSLLSMRSYVACTTEAIFGTKPSLFDLYIDGHKMNPSRVMGPKASRAGSDLAISTANDTDLERYITLKRVIKNGFLDDDSVPGVPRLAVMPASSRRRGIDDVASHPSSPEPQESNGGPPSSAGSFTRLRSMRMSLAMAKAKLRKWAGGIKPSSPASPTTSSMSPSSPLSQSPPRSSRLSMTFSKPPPQPPARTSHNSDADDTDPLFNAALSDEQLVDKTARLIEFFDRLNTSLFLTLETIERSGDPILRSCRIRNLLQLHPAHDLPFLQSLVAVYKIAIVVDTVSAKPAMPVSDKSIGGSIGRSRIRCECCLAVMAAMS